MTAQPVTVEARQRPAPRVVRHDIDWSPIAGAVVWTPPELRVPSVDEATAMRMLRCSPESFAALRRLGLEPADTADGPRYEVNDVRNAGLYSRSGRTEVETALGAVLSFLRASPADLVAERRWTYELRADGEAEWLARLPTPEVFGGATTSLLVGDDPAAPPTGGERLRVPAGRGVRGTIVTAGRSAELRSRELAAMTHDFLASGVRWHYLSPGLKRDAHAAFARGVGNCDTMSVVLADRLAEAGFEPRVYRGWMVGITEVPHSWIEVTDDDGAVKVIDPSLLVLARHSTIGSSGPGSPHFADHALGSAVNRVVPTRCELAEPIGITPEGTACDTRFTCRPVAAPAGAGGR